LLEQGLALFPALRSVACRYQQNYNTGNRNGQGK
jgi:hypothetical protein